MTETNPYQAPETGLTEDSEYYYVDARRFSIRETWQMQSLVGFLIVVLFGKLLRVRFQNVFAIKAAHAFQIVPEDELYELYEHAPHLSDNQLFVTADDELRAGGCQQLFWYFVPKIGRLETMVHAWLSPDGKTLIFNSHTYYWHGSQQRYFHQMSLMSEYAPDHILVTDSKGFIYPPGYAVQTHKDKTISEMIALHEKRQEGEVKQPRSYLEMNETFEDVVRAYAGREFEFALERGVYKRLKQHEIARIREAKQPRRTSLFLWMLVLLICLILLLLG